MTALRRWLDGFFFAPVDARSVGWMRASLGLLLVLRHLAIWPELEALFGPDALLTSAPGAQATVIEGLALYRMVGDATALHALHAALLVPLLAMTVGLGGRAGVLLALGVQVALMHSNLSMTTAGGRLLRMWTLYMLTVPCAAQVSVDAWLRRRRGRPSARVVPAFATRLVQIQLCWVYLATGIVKASGGSWHRGEAVYRTLLAEHIQRFAGVPDPLWLANGLPYAATQLATWSTMGWELLFPALVCWRRTRWLALGFGVALHLGIGVTTLVGLFSLITLWGYQAFLPGAQPQGAPAGEPEPVPAKPGAAG